MQIVEIGNKQAKDQDEIIVGIDFGTTNSLIGYKKDGKIKFADINFGDYKNVPTQDILPSIIYIDGADDKKYSIRSIKRLFAKSYDEIVNNEILSSIIDPAIIINEEQKLLVKAQEGNISLQQAASKIFKHLKISAEKDLGTNIKKAVVSVPAYFNDQERGSILLAAKLAGLEVARLIAEPTAAAYAYGLTRALPQEGASALKSSAENSNYMIYDFGGGTFDVSILSHQRGVLQAIATGGDNNLGGDDIDFAIAKFLQVKDNHAEIDINLLKRAKIIKENIDDLSFLKNIENEISHEDFNNIVGPIIDKTIRIAKEVFYETEDVELNAIVLIGGSSQIKLIKEKLKKAFSCEILSDIDPSRAVALGCAMQADNLQNKNGSVLIDALPLSIGIELYGGLCEKIIMRNSSVPCFAVKKFTTHVDNQQGMKFHILQGERELAADCRSLANFELKGLTPTLAGRVSVEVTFALDSDGILSISAREEGAPSSIDIVIKPSYGVDEELIAKELESAYSNVRADHEAKLLLESKLFAEDLIAGINKAVLETPDLISNEERSDLEREISALQQLVTKGNREQIDDYSARLNSAAQKFIEKHLNFGADKSLKGKKITDIK